ncbi:MAG: hypothetical protein HYV75_07175 [Opitutae bacterium]|nr:hypothetical protein [Opitutae bacterium]
MKKWIKFSLGLGLLLVLGTVLWVVLLPACVVSAIRTKTGFAVRMDRLSVNPFTGKARISGLVLKNPAGWPEAGFVDLRQFQAEVELLSLLGDRFIASEIVVDLPRLTLVRNRDGRLFKVEPGLLQESVGALQGAGKKTGETLKTIFQSLEKTKP